MNLLNRLLNFILKSIKNNANDMTEEKLEIINYGLYLFLSDILKVSIILLIAVVFNILKPTIITLFCLGILRTFAGGVHSRTWWGCLITNSLLTFGIVYLSSLLSFLNPIITCSMLMPICFLTILLYAPSDHENKPVISKHHRKRLKITSYVILILESVTAMILVSQPYSNILIFSALATSISIFPITYKITSNHHSSYDPSTH